MSNDTPTGPPENDKSRDRRPDDAATGSTPGDTPTERFDAAGAAAGTDIPAEPYDADGADTPTERFDPVIDETPTDRFEAPTGSTSAATRILPTHGGATPATPYPTAASSGFENSVTSSMITAMSSTAPSAAPSPTEEPEEPTPTPTPTAAPPAAGPTFATFTAPTSAECEAEEGEAPLTFSWSSDDAVRAYFGVGTQNAAINPTESDLPPTATFDEVPYDCAVPSQVYTVTLEDELGALTSRTVTVTR
jgi:hypothetical protein